MPQVKKRATRSRARSSRGRSSSTVTATETVTSVKLALSTLFLGFAALAAAAAGSVPAKTNDEIIAERLARMNGATTTNSLPNSSTSTVPGWKSSSRPVFFIKSAEWAKKNLILSPGKSELGIWQITPGTEAMSLRKVTFALKTITGQTSNITDFGSLELSIGGSVQATSILNAQSQTVTFNFLKPFLVQPGYNFSMSLRGQVNGSGIMEPAAVRYFEINSDAPDALEIIDAQTAEILPPDRIRIGDDSTVSTDSPATGTKLLLHNVAPTITSLSLPIPSEVNASARIMKFAITANGDRNLVVKGLNLGITVSGLSASGTNIGKIYDFKLMEAAANGELGQQIGKTYPLCLAGAAGVTTPVKCRFANTETLFFAPETNMPLEIPAGNTRTFYIVANTAEIMRGQTQLDKAVTVSVSIEGGNGYKAGDTQYEKNWANGGLNYTYTPVSSVEKGPYTASMSYPIIKAQPWKL